MKQEVRIVDVTSPFKRENVISIYVLDDKKTTQLDFNVGVYRTGIETDKQSLIELRNSLDRVIAALD